MVRMVMLGPWAGMSEARRITAAGPLAGPPNNPRPRA